MSEWQPIDTAPTDGTIVLVGGYAKKGFFVADSKFVDGEWLLFDPRDDEYTVEFDQPPYWMPLPEPPK